jgi:hypothetical protein
MTKVDDFTFSDGLNPDRNQARLDCIFRGLECMHFSMYKLLLVSSDAAGLPAAL